MPKTNKNKSGLLDTWGRKNRKIQDKECENCGTVFRPIDSKKRTCSRKCGYSIRSNGAIKLRKKEVWWINKKGYVEGKVWIDEFTQVRIKQHRWIIENNIGRKLLKHEDVHHINGIKTDNRLENLQVLTHSEHTTLTNKIKSAINKATK